MTKTEAYRLRVKVFDALRAGMDIEQIIREARRNHPSKAVNRAVGIVITAKKERMKR